MRNATRHRLRAFSLVELLVVIAIIALLLSLTLPALTQARDNARAVVCMQNLKQINIMASIYTADQKGSMVPCIGKGPTTRVMNYYAASPSSNQFSASSGYSMSMMDLLNPSGMDYANNEPISQNPMWYCPADRPWKRFGTPTMREVNYAMNFWLSYFKTSQASDGLKYYRAADIVNPADKAFIVESHHKGVAGVRSADLQLYSQNNNSTVLTLAMVPTMYYATGAATSDSPRRHTAGFNTSYTDGHAAFIRVEGTPVWADGAATNGGLTSASWSATAATPWFDPSGSYYSSAIPAWRTIWDPTKP